MKLTVEKFTNQMFEMKDDLQYLSTKYCTSEKEQKAFMLGVEKTISRLSSLLTTQLGSHLDRLQVELSDDTPYPIPDNKETRNRILTALDCLDKLRTQDTSL